jgi:hypothetical protein
MPLNMTLSPSEEYSIDDSGRICPIYQMGWVKHPWKNAATFDEAITSIAGSKSFQDDAFPSGDCIGIPQDEWSDLLAKRYLDLEEGFFLATGVRVSWAVFRFDWGNDVFFNMRPDFCFMCLATDLGEQPINAAESKFRDKLLDFYRETDAIKRAIEAKELEPMKTYTVEWWREFWKVRGISVPDEPETAEKPTEKPLTTTERNTLLSIIAALCDYSDIKPQERGAAAQIARLTEEVRAPVTDDTIRRILAKIPDALESRMK